MQSAAQRISSSKNLRNRENIADMESGYENWRSQSIFNRLSTSLWHGWEMLRVRLRFRMKGRVWYHLSNWGSWSQRLSQVYRSRISSTPCNTFLMQLWHGRARARTPAWPLHKSQNMTNKSVPCLGLAESTKVLTVLNAEICWTIVKTTFNIIQHHSTNLKCFFLKVSRLSHFRLSLRHSGNDRAASQLWGWKSSRRASLSACACHDRDITLRLLICGVLKKNVFYIFFLNKSKAYTYNSLFAAGNNYVITLPKTLFFQHSHSAEIIGRHCIGMGLVGTLVNKSHVFLQAENN